jgi:hypothetical protein
MPQLGRRTPPQCTQSVQVRQLGRDPDARPAASSFLPMVPFHIKEIYFHIVDDGNAAMQENFSLQKICFHIAAFVKKMIDLNEKNKCLI